MDGLFLMGENRFGKNHRPPSTKAASQQVFDFGEMPGSGAEYTRNNNQHTTRRHACPVAPGSPSRYFPVRMPDCSMSP